MNNGRVRSGAGLAPVFRRCGALLLALLFCALFFLPATAEGAGVRMPESGIDLVVHLEKWEEQKEYDRFGLNDEYTSIMDVRLPRIVLPIKPGRNLAIIIEVAARNFSLKRMGYSAAQELDRRTNEMMQQKMQNRK